MRIHNNSNHRNEVVRKIMVTIILNKHTIVAIRMTIRMHIYIVSKQVLARCGWARASGCSGSSGSSGCSRVAASCRSCWTPSTRSTASSSPL